MELKDCSEWLLVLESDFSGFSGCIRYGLTMPWSTISKSRTFERIIFYVDDCTIENGREKWFFLQAKIMKNAFNFCL